MAADSPPRGPHTCPACGVAVVPGYPRCPRCQAALGEAAPAPDRPAGRELYAGGTSVGGGATAGPPWAWIGAGAAVALIAVVALTVTRCRSEPEAEVEDSEEGIAEVLAPIVEAEPDDDGPPEEVEQDDDESGRIDAAARALGNDLNRRRLWATVEVVAGGAVSIRSAYCEDEELTAVLDEVSADLAEAGVTAVRCHERHGPLVFERAP